VALIKSIKRATVIIVFAAATSVSGQDTVPEDNTGGEIENPSEPTPIGEPVVQTNPDDGSVRAGLGRIAPTFTLGRRIRLSASVTGGYDDNVNLTPTGSPSWFANPHAVFTYDFGNPRLAMDLVAGAGITYYFDHPGGRDYDPNLFLHLSLLYKASERLTFDVRAFAAYQAQPDVTSALSANRRLGNFFRSEDIISAHYRWTPRFSTVTSYTFSALEYQNSAASADNRLENQLGEELRYLLFPTTTATARYRIGMTDYQTSGRNPINQTFTAGVEQTFGPHLNGTFRSGLQLRAEQTSPYFEAGLHYSFESRQSRSGTGTYIIWTNRYSIEESGTGAGSGRETFRSNLLLNYRVTARISANLNVSYQHGSRAQDADIGFTGGTGGGGENVFDLSPGVRYAVTPSLAVNAGYRYTQLDRGSTSTIASQALSYTRNRYFAGLTFTF
jgi:opacity protein-like surface antigen